MAPCASRALPALLALLAACAPWRSDIELPSAVSAAPVLEVQGYRAPPRRTGGRTLTFGPWTAERRLAPDFGWFLTLRHDSAVIGSAWCGNDINPGDARRKGRWQDVPQESFYCDIALADDPDTLHLDVKSDVGHALAGAAESADWSFTVRGTSRLRTRFCLIMPTCGWYLTLDGMDVAAVEADAAAWVYISPDLGGEVRAMAATIAAALLLRADPVRTLGSPQGSTTDLP